MGYTTEFEGSFTIDRPVDEETAKLLIGIASTRRMKRNLKGFGVEGEFYFPADLADYGQAETPDIIDYNQPPSTQPGLWCQWLLQDNHQAIEWDGGEKFYHYIEWIKYLIDSILAPRGYVVNGEVEWSGERKDDRGLIIVKNNAVSTKRAIITYR